MILGAALDVFKVEPLDKGHPFWSLPNVLISPHNACNDEEVHLRDIELIKKNVDAFAKGQPLVNLCNKRFDY